jgi:hypothetical protein
MAFRRDRVAVILGDPPVGEWILDRRPVGVAEGELRVGGEAGVESRAKQRLVAGLADDDQFLAPVTRD